MSFSKLKLTGSLATIALSGLYITYHVTNNSDNSQDIIPKRTYVQGFQNAYGFILAPVVYKIPAASVTALAVTCDVTYDPNVDPDMTVSGNIREIIHYYLDDALYLHVEWVNKRTGYCRIIER